MGVLDQVLEYKRQRQAEREAQANAVPQALMAFQQAKQQQQDNLLKRLTVQATLAKSGLAIGPNGQLVRDSSLDPSSLLDEQLKLQRLNTLKSKESLYNKMTQETAQDSNPDKALAEASMKSGFGVEDFNIVPKTNMVAGVQHTAYVPELKKQLPESINKQYDSFSKAGLALKQNMDMLKEHPEFKKYMSPTNWKAMRGDNPIGWLGGMALQLDPNGKDFATFKAETDKSFQTYRKDVTGAQAALKELGWIAPDYPETTDNPELYIAKTQEALKRINEGEKLLLDNASAKGYRTSQLRNVKSPASKSMESVGQTSSGNKFKRIP